MSCSRLTLMDKVLETALDQSLCDCEASNNCNTWCRNLGCVCEGVWGCEGGEGHTGGRGDT